MTPGNPVVTCNFALRTVVLPYLNNLMFCEFCPIVSFAARGYIPAFVEHITEIFILRSRTQMQRVYALWIVTSMANYVTGSRFVVEHFPRFPMRAISVTQRALPFPTTVFHYLVCSGRTRFSYPFSTFHTKQRVSKFKQPLVVLLTKVAGFNYTATASYQAFH